MISLQIHFQLLFVQSFNRSDTLLFLLPSALGIVHSTSASQTLPIVADEHMVSTSHVSTRFGCFRLRLFPLKQHGGSHAFGCYSRCEWRSRGNVQYCVKWWSFGR